MAGGLGSPADGDIARMVREGVSSWSPRRSADWRDLMSRVAGSGPPVWVVYGVASFALVVILFAAFLIGSALQIGALAPQSVPAQIH